MIELSHVHLFSASYKVFEKKETCETDPKARTHVDE